MPATASTKTFATLVDAIARDVTRILFPLLFALALLYFTFGVMKFIQAAGDEKGREEAKKIIFAGIIGLTVMVSVWALVGIVAGTIGGSLILPQIKP